MFGGAQSVYSLGRLSFNYRRDQKIIEDINNENAKGRCKSMGKRLVAVATISWKVSVALYNMQNVDSKDL